MNKESLAKLTGSADRAELTSELESMYTLLSINELLNSSLELGEVLETVLHYSVDLTGAENASIFLINSDIRALEFAATTDKNAEKLENITVPLGKGIAGYVAESGETVNISDVQNDRRFYKEVDRSTGEVTRSYLCVPLKVRGEIIGTAQLMNKQNNEHFNEADQRLMQGFAVQAAIAIERALLHRQSLEKAAIEHDLNVAHDIQKRILPAGNPQIEGYSVFGYTRAARSVGGDYYHFNINREPGLHEMILADVSGKGIPASLIVSNLHSAVQLMSATQRSLVERTLSLNTFMKQNMLLGHFVTYFHLILNEEENSLEYINCGHSPPLIFRAHDDSISELELSGPVIGLVDKPVYRSFRLEMNKGDFLLVFSDGLEEAQNQSADLFGSGRIKETLRSSLKKGENAEEAGNTLIKEVNRFRDGSAINDDITMVCLQRG